MLLLLLLRSTLRVFSGRAVGALCHATGELLIAKTCNKHASEGAQQHREDEHQHVRIHFSGLDDHIELNGTETTPNPTTSLT